MQTILVVEDESASQGAFRIALDYAGYEVFTANDGMEAWGFLQNLRPHLILCDVRMPQMSGLELCAALQADARYRHIPMILMSAVALEGKAIPCAHATFLAKPITLDGLYQSVAEVLAEYEG